MQDKSWRVRYNVAAQMVPLCEALGPEMTRAELVPAYTKLLEDTEAEVRIAAAGKVSAFSRMLTPQLIVSQVGEQTWAPAAAFMHSCGCLQVLAAISHRFGGRRTVFKSAAFS